MYKSIAFIVAATVLGGSATGADPDIPTERLLYDNLVETVVTSATNYEVVYKGTLQVTHVFKGDPAIVGKTFEFADGDGSMVGAPFLPWPLQVGQKSIWLLRKTGDRLTSVPFGPKMKRTRIRIVWLPVREGDKPTRPGSPTYAEVLAWAKTVEETVKAKPSERYAIIKKHTDSTSRPMAIWAFAVLAEVDAERAPYLVWSALRGKDLPEWKRRVLEDILFDLANAPYRNPKQLDPPKE